MQVVWNGHNIAEVGSLWAKAPATESVEFDLVNKRANVWTGHRFIRKSRDLAYIHGPPWSACIGDTVALDGDQLKVIKHGRS